MKENPKLVLTGKFPELEIKDVHFCSIQECPRDDMTLFFGMDISVPKSKLGIVVADILKMRNTIENEASEDTEWQITLEKSKHKQIKLLK